jgi:hypothetical protein
MNDVRRSALKRALVSAAILAVIIGYLWRVDYAGAVLPPHGGPFLVAFATPAFMLILRSIRQLFTGEP